MIARKMTVLISHWAILLAVSVLLLLAGGNAQEFSNENEQMDTTVPERPPDATITYSQYCLGCKQTVDIYSKYASDEFKKYQIAVGKKEARTLNAFDLLDNLCDHPDMQNYQEFVRFSCLKMMSEYKQEFIKPFQGYTNSELLNNKREVFTKKKSVCVDIVHACKGPEFEDVIPKKGKQCAACRVVAQDLYNAALSKGKGVNMRDLYEEDWCNNLGYNHLHYAWLETVCDEMTEDHLKDIVEIIHFHGKIARKGLKPDKTVPDMMCEEFYGCKVPGQSTTTKTDL